MITEEKILSNFGSVEKNNLNCIISNGTLFNDNDDDNITLLPSTYRSLDETVMVLNDKSPNFIILSLNCQSINAKFDQILLLNNALKEQNVEIGAICLQETWLGEDAELSLFNIPNYNCIADISRGKYVSQHSGLMIYDKFTFSAYNPCNTPDTWECQIINIKTNNNDNKIFIVNIYQPPKNNFSRPSIEKFTSELNEILMDINRFKANILLTGDFNIDLLKIN